MKAGILALVYSTPLSALADGASYKLGPQDQLQIKVYDWRAGTGEAHGWSAFDGDIVIDSEGFISLPIIGRIPASGKNIDKLASEIAASMQRKVGLAELPTASVQVTKYRPFYITGSIEKPGEYEFRPHLSVLQALSIAGGAYRSQSNSIFRIRRDKIDRRGDLALLDAEESSLLIHQSRLETEISGGSKVPVPAALSNRPVTAAEQRTLVIEQNMFDERKNLLDSQIKSITDTRNSLAAEIDALIKKEAAIERQIDLSQKDLSMIKDLMTKGLSVSTRQLTAEQNLTSLENSKLDLQVAKFRAVQETGKLNREVIDLRSKMKQETLSELSQTRQKLAGIAEKRDAAVKALANAQVEENSYDSSPVVRRFFISRVDGSNNVRRFEANSGDSIQPGDVLEVETSMNDDARGPAGKVSLNAESRDLFEKNP